MSDTPRTVNCGDCGKELAEDPHAPVETGKPCPGCGSTSRDFQKSLRATVTARTKLSMKARHATGGRPFLKQIVGDDLHRKSGKWMKRELLIDRERNLYREVVRDPETGQIVHECKEPLSEHRDHGAAKRPEGQAPNNMSGDELTRAKDEIRQILVQEAKAQRMISYSKLVGRVQTMVFDPRDQRLNLILDEISIMEDEQGRGLLSVIVIHEGGNKMPGLGFFELARSRGRNEDDVKCWIEESQKVFSYWSQQASDPGKG